MTNVITGFHSIEEKVRAFQKKQNSSDVKIYFAKAGPRVKKIIAQALVHSPCAGAKLRKIVDTAMQVQQRHLYGKQL